MRRAFLIWSTIGLLGLAAMGADSCDSSSSSDSGGSSKPKPGFELTSVTDSQVEQLFNDKLGPKSGSRRRVRSARCNGESCVVRYQAKAIAISADETLSDQTPVWKALFKNKSFVKATLIPYTTLSSVGGKESTGPIMKVTCDRADNRQIDWDNIDADGIKKLCTVVPLVKL